jgi:deoxyadenosine/deoxycytidine kinase
MSLDKSPNYRVHLEGTIGAGKSTLLALFSSHPSVTIVEEDLVRWQAVPGCEGDGNLLGLFYANPKEYAHHFEAYVMMTKAECHQQVVPTPIKLMERSVHSAAFVFCELMKEQGFMTPMEYALMMEHARHHLKDPRVKVDLWIYLRTPHDIAMGRIQKRARPEEVGLTLEYLHALQCQYDKFFEARRAEGSRVIQINGDAEPAAILAQAKALLSALPEFSSFLFE